ncbi:MAG: nucleoside deaminase [Lacibacter sp.]
MEPVLNRSDEYFMQQALKEAERAYAAGEVPVGAVVVVQQKIIARGHNQVELLNDPTAHAEMIALSAAFQYLGAKYLPDATLYVTLEPCLMCTGALYWSKLGRIVWGADDEKNGHRRITGNYEVPGGGHFPFHPRAAITKGVLEEACARLLKQFFQEQRKNKA